jgi:hypothetical protein
MPVRSDEPRLLREAGTVWGLRRRDYFFPRGSLRTFAFAIFFRRCGNLVAGRRLLGF